MVQLYYLLASFSVLVYQFIFSVLSIKGLHNVCEIQLLHFTSSSRKSIRLYLTSLCRTGQKNRLYIGGMTKYQTNLYALWLAPISARWDKTDFISLCESHAVLTKAVPDGTKNCKTFFLFANTPEGRIQAYCFVLPRQKQHYLLIDTLALHLYPDN